MFTIAVHRRGDITGTQMIEIYFCFNRLSKVEMFVVLTSQST